MGRKLKRGTAGNAAQYLTRNQAIKKLQLRLSEFRRLCILKGIHPREPKKKVKGANKTYYHVKDINWLMHEPLINTFRTLKVHERKVRKARAKQNMALARRLLSHTPGYRLDHLVKERYPSFVDALRDLDDPLTLIHLFAALPAEGRYGIAPNIVARCRRLAMEWQAWVARTGSLRRVFISVKGFYYQAEVQGQLVTWLVPHGLAQVLPHTVDYKIMLTFLEYYCTLTSFVLFKLYHQLGLRYPPVLDRKAEEAAAGLAAIFRDIAGLAQAEEQQQPQEQPDQPQAQGQQGAAQGGGAASGGGATADIVDRLATLSRKLQELKEGGGGSEGEDGSEGEESDDAADLEIDSGAEEEGGSGGGGSEGEEEEELGEGEEESEVDSGAESSEEAQEGKEGAAGDEPAANGAGAAGAHDGAAAAPVRPELLGGASGAEGADDASVCSSLFRGLVFFLAREVPREPLLFIIRAFGGSAAWDGAGSPHTESDEAITHQVVDRPTQGHRFLSRHYVQPQWVVDSANFKLLMPSERYVPGKPPPPHLSPFVEVGADGYTPEWAEEVARMQEAACQARQRAAGAAVDGAFLSGAGAGDGVEADEVDEGAAGGSGQQADAAAAEAAYQRELARELRAAERAEASGGGSDEGEGEEEGSGSEGGEGAGGARGGPAAARQQARGEEGEVDTMKSIMMSRKSRKLYERIKRAQQGQAERVEVLQRRKQALEAAQAAQAAAAAAEGSKAAKPGGAQAGNAVGGKRPSGRVQLHKAQVAPQKRQRKGAR